jgi:FtsP/CotA-like multicopper oxidase with cupredoxin domain
VRIKFLNQLLTGAAGNLPLPVDTTVMGAGMGPLSATELYTQTRADLHLHGGATPWISDGTPHQWVTPTGELTSYPKGVAFANVPDMVTGAACRGGAKCVANVASDGVGTYYYTNQQSARLMFYHDHAYGITRLNVYDGMAAGYLLYDQYEEDMISGTNVYGVNPTNAKFLPDLGGLYHYGIPLVFQDKSFVNDASTPSAAAIAAFPKTGYVQTPKTLATDPLWAYYTPPYVSPGVTGGNLWFPHEYMPVENPFDPTGNTPNGRWDYAPFMIPPMIPLNTTLPSPTLIPEGFQDTAIVNGTAFPYVALPPDAIRFRILSAGNDRSLNLQLYYAKDHVTGQICKAGNTFTVANCTEVSMVPAAPNAAFPSWPRDGRDGGVPDPLTKGPDWIQIGNEAGLLAKVAIYPAQPIDYNYNRQVIPLAGVTSRSLLLLPAMRADVVVDFSKASNGDVLIVYNDAPAAMPNFWPLNDYYTDGPDQTATGGPVTIPPGFGPNTRTFMQIRITGSKTSSFDFSSNGPDPTGASYGASLKALIAELPKVFAASQDPIIVPQLAYNAAYPSGPHHFAGTTDNYVQAYQTTMNITGTGSTVAKIMTAVPGNNYPTPPTVVIAGGGGIGATATAGLNPMGAITLLTAGSGYTTVPVVTLGAPNVAGVQATAVATISGGTVNAITIVEPGSGYTSALLAPTCTVAAPAGVGGVAATCSVMLSTLNTVGSITVTNPGTGYTSQPQVYLLPTTPGGVGASATALLSGALVMTGKNMTEGFDVEYGRMDIKLGSTPNPLTPGVGAGFVLGIARYIDPPTEVMNDGETVLWRLAHLGVDSHAMHFHLFNVQVINHVDWTGVIKPPYDDEIGWKETIRTNPMEDIILAIRPKSQVLPFVIPNSNRVLDPTTAANSTTNFYPVPPPPGVVAVAQQSNVMTNFGWEYVWHCHLLGHEENDMMRPIVFVVPSVVPLTLAAPTATLTPGTGNIAVSWVQLAASTSANAPTGYLVQRAPTTGAFATIATINDSSILTYADTVPHTAGSVTYRYRIVAFNDVGNSVAPYNITSRPVPVWTAPTVAISSPLNLATYTSPATIPFTATVTGVVTKVEYYYGSSLLGSATLAPFTFNFAGVNPGTLTLTAKAYTAAGATGVSPAVTVTVTVPVPLVISTTSPLTAYSLGTGAYSATLAATGGTAPYTWAVATGSTLPAGLTLSAAGVLSGTPTTAGSYGFSLQVTDSRLPAPAATTVQAFTLVVSPAALAIATTSPMTAYTLGSAYTAPVLTATGGTAPYTWAVATGSTLPAGLTLTAGALTGTPTTAGTYNFSLQVTDSHLPAPAVTTVKAFTLVVSPAAVAVAPAKIGIFRNNGEWFLDKNGNGAWDAGVDTVFAFGNTGDVPISGNWSGTGTTTSVGIFRNGQFFLNVSGTGTWNPATDVIYNFGMAGDIPVTGVWNGTGGTKIGVFRSGQWFLDMNGNGAWDPATDVIYNFGNAGDIPVTGDWNGNGTTKIGVFRNGQWFLDLNGNGAWDPATDAIYNFGIPGDIPITGDWNGSGTTKIGIFRNGQFFLDMNGNGVFDPGVDVINTFGTVGDVPVIGKW